MMNLIQLLTDQRAYEGITHSRWGASWNWRWRKVGDDEDRRSPLSGAPNGLQIWPPDEEQETVVAPSRETR